MQQLRYTEFLDKIFTNLHSAGIETDGLLCDHVAYRATTETGFAELYKELCAKHKLLDVAIIRDRKIAIFKFKTPVKYHELVIPYFELMAPAEGDKFEEGLEHAEFVVSDIEEFKNKYPYISFDFKERKINPELVLRFENNANIKFHTRDIEEVVRLQAETGEL